MKFLLLFTLLFAPAVASAQTYGAIAAAYPGAQETTVTNTFATIYEAPSLDSPVVGRYSQGRTVLAYRMAGDFYAVAVRGRGHVGYVLLTDLDVPQVPGAAVAPSTRAGYIEPADAQLMGLVLPGGGHIFAGETATGAALLALSAGGFIGGYALSESTRELSCPEGQLVCDDTVDYTALVVGSAIAVGAWAFSFLDADNAAKRSNARLGLAIWAGPAPMLVAGRARPGVALEVRW